MWICGTDVKHRPANIQHARRRNNECTAATGAHDARAARAARTRFTAGTARAATAGIRCGCSCIFTDPRAAIGAGAGAAEIPVRGIAACGAAISCVAGETKRPLSVIREVI